MTAAQIDALRSSAPVQGAAALAAAQAGAPSNVSAIAAAANQITRGLVAVDLADDIQASRQYAEDVRMMGLSFNTTVGNASVFGELAYRPNLPIGIATTNDLLEQVLQQAPEIAQGQQVQVGGQTVSLANRSISNYERVEAFNTSLGTIYNFGPSLGFDSLFGIAELASEHIRGSSLKYTDFRGDVLYYSGRANGSYTSGYGRDDQINKNSYGYTLVLSGTWNDVYAGVNLSPFAVFKHDFEGNSHQTGNFIEGRKAYTVGMRASYLNSLEAEIQYTEFYGAGQNNGARDRDNIGVNVKYSF